MECDRGGQLKLAYQDDTPVQDANGFVTISHGFSHNQDDYNKTRYPVPRNGIIELTFYPPVDENVHTLGIEVSVRRVLSKQRLLWLTSVVYFVLT